MNLQIHRNLKHEKTWTCPGGNCSVDLQIHQPLLRNNPAASLFSIFSALKMIEKSASGIWASSTNSLFRIPSSEDFREHPDQKKLKGQNQRTSHISNSSQQKNIEVVLLSSILKGTKRTETIHASSSPKISETCRSNLFQILWIFLFP